MLSYCFKCRRNTKSINPKGSKTTNGKAIILSTCAICGSKKSKFIKQQEAKGLLSSLGLRTPLNKSIRRYFVLIKYKMNNLINKFLLAGDRFMPEIHLRQPQFTYSACGTFTRHEERIQKFKETGDTNYVFKNELDKACFVHDAAYSDSKDLTKRTIADKNLKNREFDIPKDPKYDGYQRGLDSMVYKFFDSKVSGSGAKLIPENEQLANELHKPIIRKFEKGKVYSTFKDNIWVLI